MNQYDHIVRCGTASYKTCLNKQTCCSSVLASTSPDIRANQTQLKQKKTKDKKKPRHSLFALREPLNEIVNWPSAAVLKNPKCSSSRETGRGSHTHRELHRRPADWRRTYTIFSCKNNILLYSNNIYDNKSRNKRVYWTVRQNI